MYDPNRADLDARGVRVGLAVSRYHEDVTRPMQQGAVEVFTAAGGKAEDVLIVDAPGAFELPLLARSLAARDDLDGVVAIGCVIRGETSHDQHIAQAVADGLMRVALDSGKPVAFGVLTCHTKHQARERAGGEAGNKGAEAMAAVLEAIGVLRRIEGTKT
jgi:6,7-dimethyl-8-ribityllumazine synthase